MARDTFSRHLTVLPAHPAFIR